MKHVSQSCLLHAAFATTPQPPTPFYLKTKVFLKRLGRSHMAELPTQISSSAPILPFPHSVVVTWSSSLLCAHPMSRMFSCPHRPCVFLQFLQDIICSNFISVDKMSLTTARKKSALPPCYPYPLAASLALFVSMLFSDDIL